MNTFGINMIYMCPIQLLNKLCFILTFTSFSAFTHAKNLPKLKPYISAGISGYVFLESFKKNYFLKGVKNNKTYLIDYLSAELGVTINSKWNIATKYSKFGFFYHEPYSSIKTTYTKQRKFQTYSILFQKSKSISKVAPFLLNYGMSVDYREGLDMYDFFNPNWHYVSANYYEYKKFGLGLQASIDANLSRYLQVFSRAELHCFPESKNSEFEYLFPDPIVPNKLYGTLGIGFKFYLLNLFRSNKT